MPTGYEQYEDVSYEKVVRMLDKAIKLAARYEVALKQIAEQCEMLEAMGEPQNNVPQFCRAILRGEDVTLKGM